MAFRHSLAGGHDDEKGGNADDEFERYLHIEKSKSFIDDDDDSAEDKNIDLDEEVKNAGPFGTYYSRTGCLIRGYMTIGLSIVMFSLAAYFAFL